MKKAVALLLALLLTVTLTSSALAHYRVPEIQVDVALRSDGSAYITQIWDADIDEGTEIYLPIRSSGYLTITDFSVADEGRKYEYTKEWDIDASFAEKAYRCGLVETDEGYELCWGISEYGKQRYTIGYVVHDIVGAYSDSDGFNFRFINDKLNFTPTDVMLGIYLEDGTPLTDDNCSIWAFGYEGQIRFRDGMILAWTERPIRKSNHLTIMVELDKGVVSPLRAENTSFETVKEQAFKGSDYASDQGIMSVIFGIIAIVSLLAICGVVSVRLKKRKIKKLMNAADYFRDLPNGGDLNATYVLSNVTEQCEEGAIIGTRILKLINMGCLEPETTESVGSMGKTKENVNMHLVRQPHKDGDEYDQQLYTILESSAGSDGILQPGELEKFCEAEWMTLRSFLDKCTLTGNGWLIKRNCLKGAKLKSVKNLTGEGLKQLAEVLGLKKFLLDFSLIAERGVKETVIWQDYLVYATLLGIADKVGEQMRQVYPQQVPEIERYQEYAYRAYSYNTLMYSAMRRRQRQYEAARSAGRGGHSSRRGGGGFSGGGSGGGVR